MTVLFVHPFVSGDSRGTDSLEGHYGKLYYADWEAIGPSHRLKMNNHSPRKEQKKSQSICRKLPPHVS